MSFKKMLAVVMACAMAIGAFAASALTLDVAEAADDGVIAEAVLAESNVAKIGDTFYATVQEAVDAAQDGTTVIELLPGTIDENVFILQQKDKNIVIKGSADVVYTGGFEICGNNRGWNSGAQETLTFEGINFKGEDYTVAHDFIGSTRKNTLPSGTLVWAYPHNVTVRNCTFVGNYVGQSAEAYTGLEVVAMRNVGGYNWTIENCTGTNLHSLYQASANTLSSKIDKITVTDCQSGLNLGTQANYTITNSTISVDEFAIRADMNGTAADLVIDNCNLTAAETIVLRRDATTAHNLVITDSSIVSTLENPAHIVRSKHTVNSNVALDIDLNYWGGVAPSMETLADVKPEILPYYADEDMTAIGGVAAKIGNEYFNTLVDAINAAQNGDTIDLLGNVIDLPEVNSLKIKNDLTIKNGTIDITNGTWNGNSIIEVYGGTADDFVVATFEDVDFVGENYSSAFGVIYAYNYGKVVINSCDFNLKDEKYSAGGVLKGNGIAVSAFDVTDSSFNLENPNRIIANATVALDNVKIRAAVTDDTLAVGDMNNHAFRNLVGTVNNSDIQVSGFETGIKNTEGDLAVSNNSVIKLENSKDTDLVIGAGKKLTVDESSAVYADTSDIADDAITGNVVVKANIIKVEFVQVDGDAEGYDLYNINLVGANDEVINRLNSADLTFVLDATPVTGAAVNYEIIPVKNVTVTPDTTTPDEDRFMFNFNGKDLDVIEGADTAKVITIAQVKVSGYGTYTFSVDTTANATNVAHATTISDNIVDTFVPGGAAGKGTLDLGDATTGKVTIAVPVRTLTVNVAFPNSVVDNAAAYQDMKVEITGNIDGVHQTVTYDLGGNMEADGTYVVEETRLVLNETYNVVVSGAGYRTARYTVTMTDAKTLNFWNNVKDNAVEVEEGKASSAVAKNFLAGDIVGDNQINIYDLSAVVSYFATEITDEADYDKYVKYDLNRDGKIDSKDVAYVLVSWGA